MLERFWLACGHCHGDAACPLAAEMKDGAAPPRTGVARLPIPLTAVTVFLLPLVCAIGGALLGGRLWADGTFASVGRWQTIGTLAGLAAGAGLAKVLLYAMHRIWTGRRRSGE